MGKITTLVFASVVVFLVVTYLPGLPPYMEFTAQSITPPMELKGVLALNERLNNAEHLFKGEVKGAESFAVHKGSLYSGLHGGYIVKIVASKVIPVTKFGSSQCLGFWDEAKCGRPLGLKSGKDGYLYVADAYYGLYKVNTTTGASTLLVSKNVAINGKEPRLPNSVDVAKDGTIYWTDSSTDILLQDGLYALLGDGSGRYYLKGPKKGQKDIFLDGLPGLPDNLKSNGRGGFYVPLIVGRDMDHSVLSQQLAPYPTVRKFLARVLALIELSFQQVEALVPNYYTQRAIHWLLVHDKSGKVIWSRIEEGKKLHRRIQKGKVSRKK
uniref:Adipocyte plasma membrane-associated protein n=1 Tax=Timema cristinae TaxID=61476 RepID=A0A7R9CPU4_TIMCR|nr:unnamed protein product [Timema cristinae]